jgi:hypothetical protein
MSAGMQKRTGRNLNGSLLEPVSRRRVNTPFTSNGYKADRPIAGRSFMLTGECERR